MKLVLRSWVMIQGGPKIHTKISSTILIKISKVVSEQPKNLHRNILIVIIDNGYILYNKGNILKGPISLKKSF